MSTKDSILGLAGRVLAGEYENENELRSQVMRVYRGVEFAPPDGQRVVLAGAEAVVEPAAGARGTKSTEGRRAKASE